MVCKGDKLTRHHLPEKKEVTLCLLRHKTIDDERRLRRHSSPCLMLAAAAAASILSAAAASHCPDGTDPGL